MRSRIFAEKKIDYHKAVELALALEAADQHTEASGAGARQAAGGSGGGGGAAAERACTRFTPGPAPGSARGARARARWVQAGGPVKRGLLAVRKGALR